MILKDISLCSNKLDFSCSTKFSDLLPAYSWGDFLLTHHSRKTGMTVDLRTPGVEFEGALKAVYPDLSFIELSKLHQKINSLNDIGSLQLSWRKLFQLYGLHFNENLSSIIEVLNCLPEKFQKWGHDKKLGPKDLAILRCLPKRDRGSIQHLELLSAITNCISIEQPTKSLGVSILEKTIELILGHGYSSELLKLADETQEAWVLRLAKLRYPQVSASDNSKSELLKKLSNPKHIQTQWKRIGDAAGVEVKFLSQSSQDFAQKITSLNKWLPQIKEEFWNE